MAEEHRHGLPQLRIISRTSSSASKFLVPSEAGGLSKGPSHRVHATSHSPLRRSTDANFHSTRGASSEEDEYGRALEQFRSEGNYSERESIPGRNLGILQIASLTINSMIGSGIVTTPGYILLLTRSKTVALLLWGAGGAYTLISQLLFLEYGIALPFNGGPLIYLDEVFRHPRLLFSILFAVHRILLASTAGNSRVIAVNFTSIFLAGSSNTQIPELYTKTVAVVVQSTACLFLFFCRRTCFVMNAPFAVLKVGYYLLLAILGFSLPHGDHKGSSDWAHKPGYSGLGALSAMTHIIYSYQGFEDINCVAGEIKHVGIKWRRAVYMAIPIVIIVYMLMVASIFYALEYSEIVSDAGVNDISVVFAQRIFGHTTVIKVFCSVFEYATLVTEVYITARVKQAIAWQRIVPFYKFFATGGKPIDDLGGALVLHWIFSVIALIAVPTNTDARLFVAGIYSYGYQVVNLGLAIGLLRLPRKMRAKGRFKLAILKNNFVRWLVATLFAGFSIITLVMSALGNANGDIPHKYWPASVGAVMMVGLLYWSGFRILNMRLRKDGPTIGKLVGFQVHYDRPSQAIEWQGTGDNSDPGREDADNDIKWRSVTYELGPRLQAIVKWITTKTNWIYETAYPEDLQKRQSRGQ